MKKISKAILTLTAVGIMAVPAMAADKLVVKGTGGAAGNVLTVKDNGITSARGAWSESDGTTINPDTGKVLNQVPVFGVYNNDVMRMNVMPIGITQWQLNSGGAEAGFIEYATPGGGVGFSLLHANRTNKFDIGYYPNVGGAPRLLFTGPSGVTNIVFNTTGEVGIGAIPTQKFEVNGGIRINTATAKPVTCDATIRGTIWFTQGTTDTLQICALTGTGYGWKTIALP